MWIKRCCLVAVVLLVSTALAFDWPWQRRQVNRRPFADQWFTPIVQQYHVCDRCGSLDGGNYGKGPTKSFRTEMGNQCVHQWRPITRNEFRALAAERFKVDWSKEIPFWAHDVGEK
jgi:hypothetical protein